MSATDHTLTVCIGSNLLARPQFESALKKVCAHLTQWRMSGIVSSADVTGRSTLPYLNAIVAGHTQLPLQEADRIFAAVEATFGRTQESKASGLMPLDIDIVVWDDHIIRPNDYGRKYFQLCMATMGSQS